MVNILEIGGNPDQVGKATADMYTNRNVKVLSPDGDI